ncbi:MAG TPA: glycosyltransferase family 2 protein, partial [Gammaproteobacteria bacterium]
MSETAPRLSIVIPAKDEAASLPKLLAELKRLHPEAELIVVDDGSGDATGDVARQAGALVVRNPHSMGNGAAIKAGARAARGRLTVCMDADGQHLPADVGRLLELHAQGYDMVVGAR